MLSIEPNSLYYKLSKIIYKCALYKKLSEYLNGVRRFVADCYDYLISNLQFLRFSHYRFLKKFYDYFNFVCKSKHPVPLLGEVWHVPLARLVFF